MNIRFGTRTCNTCAAKAKLERQFAESDAKVRSARWGDKAPPADWDDPADGRHITTSASRQAPAPKN